MALLEVRGLEKWYGRRQVVNGVEFDVDQGEVVGLLGPNGAGKTTSFRMTIGLIDADGGSVVFDGRDVTRLPMYLRARAGMGYLAQDSSVFRQLTVEQNLMAILETRRDMTRKQKKDRLNDLMDRFGLNKIRHTKAHMVSGGERRRTEIARALITDPKLIMLDEPFAGIDPKTVGEIQEQIRDLVDTFHIGILLTDHQFRETLEVTDRCYVIREGRVFAYGDREQILNNAEVRRHYIGERFDGGHLLSESHKPMSSIARTQTSLPPAEPSKDAPPAPTPAPEAASPPAPTPPPAPTAPPKPPAPPTVRITSVSGPRPSTPKPASTPPLPTRLVDPDDPEDVQSTIVNEDRGYGPGGNHSIQVNQIPPGFNIDDLYDK